MAASAGEGTCSHVCPHPNFWKEDFWKRKRVRVKGRAAVRVLEEAGDGKDGLTPGAGRAAAPCSLGCKSNPVMRAQENLWRKLKGLGFRPGLGFRKESVAEGAQQRS